MSDILRGYRKLAQTIWYVDLKPKSLEPYNNAILDLLNRLEIAEKALQLLPKGKARLNKFERWQESIDGENWVTIMEIRK